MCICIGNPTDYTRKGNKKFCSFLLVCALGKSYTILNFKLHAKTIIYSILKFQYASLQRKVNTLSCPSTINLPVSFKCLYKKEHTKYPWSAREVKSKYIPFLPNILEWWSTYIYNQFQQSGNCNKFELKLKILTESIPENQKDPLLDLPRRNQEPAQKQHESHLNT